MLVRALCTTLVLLAVTVTGCDNGSFSGGNGHADADAEPHDGTDWHGGGGPDDFIDHMDDTGWYGRLVDPVTIPADHNPRQW